MSEVLGIIDGTSDIGSACAHRMGPGDHGDAGLNILFKRMLNPIW